jgi:hypothetical protein
VGTAIFLAPINICFLSFIIWYERYGSDQGSILQNSISA